MAVHKGWKLNTSGIQWKPTSQALSKIDRKSSSLETDTNPDEGEKRKEKGLYFKCNEKWSLGHKCSCPKLFLIKEVDEEEDMVLKWWRLGLRWLTKKRRYQIWG
jgi:hypothetical protein